MSDAEEKALIGARDRDVAAFWDDRFDRDDYLYGTRPNAFLAAESWRLDPRSTILVLGDGEGRNGVWLAEQGHRVWSVDISPRGVQKATKLALDRGVTLRTQVADLLTWEWPVAVYDAIVSLFVPFPPAERARIHARIRDALKPGGLFLQEHFGRAQIGRPSGGPKNPDLLPTPEDLARDFDGFTIALLDEGERVLDEGPGHQGAAITVRMVARKPTGTEA